MPNWIKENNIDTLEAPEELKYWLKEPECLTQALAEHFTDVHIEHINTGFDEIYEDERRYLAPYHQSERFLVRQTHLVDTKGQKLTYARVIIPEETYLAFKNDFDTLGTNPIGETLLFYKDHVKRSTFECASLAPYEWQTIPALNKAMAHYINQKQKLGARRSLFCWNKRPLLISEFFIVTPLTLNKT